MTAQGGSGALHRVHPIIYDSRAPGVSGRLQRADSDFRDERIEMAFESTGIHPLNPRMVLGKLNPGQSGGSRNVTRPNNDSECCIYKRGRPLFPYQQHTSSCIIQYQTTVPHIHSTGYEPGVNSDLLYFYSIHRISSTEFLLCLSICLYLQLHEQAHATITLPLSMTRTRNPTTVTDHHQELRAGQAQPSDDATLLRYDECDERDDETQRVRCEINKDGTTVIDKQPTPTRTPMAY